MAKLASVILFLLTVQHVLPAQPVGSLGKSSTGYRTAGATTAAGAPNVQGSTVAPQPEEDMEDPEWLLHPKAAEVEEAKHGLDFFHYDVSQTGMPLITTVILLFMTLVKPLLHFHCVKSAPEAVVLMIIGIAIAFLIRQFYTPDIYLTPKLFFCYLLPFIVSDAGLTLVKKLFFGNIVSILMYAVFGTILNTLMISGILYFFSEYYTMEIPFLHLVLFSALISAVDPVTVLSTFAEIEVNATLFILIFGESLLNDAVTIVLYRTCLSIIKLSDANHVDLTFGPIIAHGSIQFGFVSFGGILIGLIGAVLGVFTMKWYAKYQTFMPVFHTGIPYTLYLLADTFHVSGIMSMLVSSMFFAHYMSGNVCAEMEMVMFFISKTLASISEMVIFIYLGLSCVSDYHMVDVIFCLVTVGSCLIVRTIVIYACSFVLNLFRKEKVTIAEQTLMIHSGIRGAVCFGLVMTIDERVVAAKPIFVTATLVEIAFTSLFQGCTIKPLMRWLKIQDIVKTESYNKMTWLSQFSKFDKKYLRPLLTIKNTAQAEYLTSAASFHELALPPAVSSALRLGERSTDNMARQTQVSPVPVSVPKSTAPPTDAKEDESCQLTISGRRTPRGSMYSRHFYHLAPPSPTNFFDTEDQHNPYLTFPYCKPATSSKTDRVELDFDANQTVGAIGFRRTRHDSIQEDGQVSKPRKPLVVTFNEQGELSRPIHKTSRTVVSGKKTFTVGGEETIPLNAINEESSSKKNSKDESPSTSDDKD